MTRYLPLVCLALLHTTVDTCALWVAPLWPGLETKFGLGVAALSVAFIVQSMPTSLSQAVFGYVRDRRATPWVLWAGPVCAACFLCLIGATANLGVLYVLLIVGGIGVGAFHPEGAVVAGRMIPEQRTRSLSLFMFGGSLGLALGPTLSGLVVSRWGMEGLSRLMLPMLAAVMLLAWMGGFLKRPAQQPAEQQAAGSRYGGLEGRAPLALLLLLICSLRLVPNMAMDKVLAFTMESRGFGTSGIGMTQSLFLISASAGMFIMAFRFRPGWEQPFMIWCPVAGIPLLLLLGWSGCPGWLFTALLVPTGLLLWGTTPAMVSYAQQLFPKGAGLASAITMGMSWGIGGLIQAPITAYFQSQQAFHAFIPFLVIGAVGAYLLPAASEAATQDSAPDLAAQPALAGTTLQAETAEA